MHKFDIFRTNEERAVYEGFGQIIYADGTHYTGLTKNGYFNGKGKLVHSNGDVYMGEFVDGKAEGYGVFVDSRGTLYKGNWTQNVYDGKGEESWDFGASSYSGQFIEGVKYGHGKLDLENGN